MSKMLFYVIGALMFMLTSCSQESKELYMFVGTYAQESESGIYLYRFNTEDGSAVLIKEVSGIVNPTYMNLSKDEKFLYAVAETAVPDAKVHAYSFDKKTEDVRLLNTKATEGSSPCHIWVDSKNRLTATANYASGSISAFPLLPTGELGELKLYTYEGGTPGSRRQNAPHLHCIYSSPDEKYLYANDLGTDRIYKYDLIPGEGGKLTLKEGQPAYFSVKAGEGPRHTTFHPNGKFAYLISELSGNVAVLKYDNGNLNPVQYIEADSLHASASADIHITPDGRFLYVSNRMRGDGVAIFSIDMKSGLLTKIGYQPTEKIPRNFIITPDGGFLLCACQNGNVIQVFAIDKKNGQLKNINKDINVSKPVCLKFAKI